ncbi:MAG: class I SAM-dependent methyltransferase [bacterium]|nr:class I SAM-dependent methyltransferase [bacterium]MDA1024727.1 class I SAM-dependent methyltransferase [bacterium]
MSFIEAYFPHTDIAHGILGSAKRIAVLNPGRHGGAGMAIALKRPEATVYLVDHRKNELEAANLLANRHALHGVKTIWGNAEKFRGSGFRDAHIDVALMTHGLMHLMEPYDFASEMRRILRPEGRLIFFDYHPRSLHPIARLAPHLHEPSDTAAFFARCGFELKRHIPISANEWAIVLQRV